MMATGYLRAFVQIKVNGKVTTLQDIERVIDKNGQWVDINKQTPKRIDAKVVRSRPAKKGHEK